jgi:hypothetical protein
MSLFYGDKGAVATNPELHFPQFPLPQLEIPKATYADPKGLFNIPALNNSLPLPAPPPPASLVPEGTTGNHLFLAGVGILAMFLLLRK